MTQQKRINLLQALGDIHRARIYVRGQEQQTDWTKLTSDLLDSATERIRLTLSEEHENGI